MSDKSHILDHLPAYALGCLEEDEAVLVSKHLRECADCQAELAAFQSVADNLALASPDATLPPGLKPRLMNRIQTPPVTPPVRPQASRPPFWQRLMPAWGVLSLFLILVLAVANLLLWQRINRLEITTGPGEMQSIPLSGADIVPNAAGFVIISADGLSGALVVDQLPPLDTEYAYQLWLIKDGQRTSGAVFSVDENGYGGTRISAEESLFSYTAVGVTIEPAEGSPGPTGDNVLNGLLVFDP